MSEPSQVTSTPTFDTINPRLAALPPRISLRKQQLPRQHQPQPQPKIQMQQQTQSQSQSQPQSHCDPHLPTDPPTRKSGKKRTSRGPKTHRSKSSSPEKIKPVHREPVVRLHPLHAYIDSPGESRNVTTGYSVGQRYLAGAPAFVPDERWYVVRAQTDEIRKRAGSSVSRYGGEVSRESLSHAQAYFGNDVFRARGLSQGSGVVSPERSPTSVSVELNQAQAGLGGADEEGSEKSESDDGLPFYASLFRPRLAPSDGLGIYTSPFPSCSSIGQVVAVKEALTRFHMGIALMDELAGKNQVLWSEGLRRVVDDCMPGLRSLGVRAHQIVFFYHGRGDIPVGRKIWDEIMAWQWRQTEMQRIGSWPRESGHSHRQGTEWNGKQESEQRERESKQQEDLEQSGAEREKIRQMSKPARQWNDVATQEASKSLTNGVSAPRLWTIYEDIRGDRKILW